MNKTLEWRLVPGFSRYEVSADGHIRTARRLPTRPKHYPLRGSISPFGYVSVKVTDDCGIKRRRGVHQLICLTFHGPPPSDQHEVAHNNGVPDDNRAENLRWATRKENHADIQKHGTHIKGERNGRAKLTEEMVIAARKAHKHGATVSELARYYGMSHSGMLSAVRAGNWSHVN